MGHYFPFRLADIRVHRVNQVALALHQAAFKR